MPFHEPKTKSEIVKEYAKAHGIPVVDLPMSKPKEHDTFMEPLPEWVERKAHPHELVRKQQLITRNPRSRGNATILEVCYKLIYSEVQFIIGTDAGNIIKATLNELIEMYDPGMYVLKELPNPKLYEKLEELDYE